MKRYLLFVFIIILAGAFYGLYQYNRPHKDLHNAEAHQSTSAMDLFTAFELNESKSNELYLGKVLEVNGVLRSKSSQNGTTTLTLDTGSDMFGILCGMESNAFKKKKQDPKPGDEITVRCVCAGMLMDVVLERCVLIE